MADPKEFVAILTGRGRIAADWITPAGNDRDREHQRRVCAVKESQL
jgi:hypothetical protein